MESLFQAWNEFKKGKRGKLDVGQFERSLEDAIFRLHQELADKGYRHSSYKGFYLRDPKIRHIHKAIVKDRIIHHVLFRTLNPIFEPTFISDSYSGRRGYGHHKGFKRLVTYARRVSKNYTRICWALKCDIRRFFDNVDHTILLKMIETRVKDSDLMWLVREIVESYQTVKDKGIPIGNLTSQLFANVYLSDLDRFVKQELKATYYLRYADDFVLLSSDRDQLIKYLVRLKLFLDRELKLNLHLGKVELRKLRRGIDFLGYVARPFYQTIRTKTRRRIFFKLRQKVEDFRQGQINERSFNQSIQSYLGLLVHVNSFKLRQELINSLFFWFGDQR